MLRWSGRTEKKEKEKEEDSNRKNPVSTKLGTKVDMKEKERGRRKMQREFQNYRTKPKTISNHIDFCFRLASYHPSCIFWKNELLNQALQKLENVQVVHMDHVASFDKAIVLLTIVLRDYRRVPRSKSRELWKRED